MVMLAVKMKETITDSNKVNEVCLLPIRSDNGSVKASLLLL